MGNKVSRIAFNGEIIEVNDPDAINIENPGEASGLLAYNYSLGGWLFQSIKDAIGLQQNLNNSDEYPISSKAVKDEFDRLENKLLSSDDIVYLDYFYNKTNNKLSARASDKNGREIEIKDKLDILVFSLKSSYNSTSQTYAFDHYLGKITINTLGPAYPEHYFEGDITIPNSEQDRVLYFVIINPIGISGQYRMSRNNFISANNTENTATLSSSDAGDSQVLVNVIFNTPLTDSMKVRFVVSDGRFNELVSVYDFTVQSGNASTGVTLGPSGYKRFVTFEILENGNNPIYNIVNNNLSINGNIPIRTILFYHYKEIDSILAQIIDGNIELNRNQKYSFGSASSIHTGFPLGLKVYSDNIPSPGYMRLNGSGQLDSAIIEQIQSSHPSLEDINIIFEGNNIYLLENCNEGEFIIDKLESDSEVDIDPANYNFKYFVDDIGTFDYIQYEIWFVDEEGYLQSCYKNPLYYI